MLRRTFVSGCLCAAAFPRVAFAQPRTDWRPDGPLEGREPVDPSELTAEERRHVPRLMLPERVRRGQSFDLVLQAGLEPHVMVEGHYIDWMEVALGDRRVFVCDLAPGVSYPIVRVPLRLDAATTLTARAHCTRHGAWRTRRDLEVY